MNKTTTPEAIQTLSDAIHCVLEIGGSLLVPLVNSGPWHSVDCPGAVQR